MGRDKGVQGPMQDPVVKEVAERLGKSPAQVGCMGIGLVGNLIHTSGSGTHFQVSSHFHTLLYLSLGPYPLGSPEGHQRPAQVGAPRPAQGQHRRADLGDPRGGVPNAVQFANADPDGGRDVPGQSPGAVQVTR